MSRCSPFPLLGPVKICNSKFKFNETNDSSDSSDEDYLPDLGEGSSDDEMEDESIQNESS